MFRCEEKVNRKPVLIQKNFGNEGDINTHTQFKCTHLLSYPIASVCMGESAIESMPGRSSSHGTHQRSYNPNTHTHSSNAHFHTHTHTPKHTKFKCTLTQLPISLLFAWVKVQLNRNQAAAARTAPHQVQPYADPFDTNQRRRRKKQISIQNLIIK